MEGGGIQCRNERVAVGSFSSPKNLFLFLVIYTLQFCYFIESFALYLSHPYLPKFLNSTILTYEMHYFINTPTLPTYNLQAGRELKVEDALLYLDQVKMEFADKPHIYEKFLEIMKNFKAQSINTPGVIERVKNLFKVKGYCEYCGYYGHCANFVQILWNLLVLLSLLYLLTFIILTCLSMLFLYVVSNPSTPTHTYI